MFCYHFLTVTLLLLLPCFALSDSSVMLSFLVVQLIVAGVSLSGGSCYFSPRLSGCSIASSTWKDKDEHDQKEQMRVQFKILKTILTLINITRKTNTFHKLTHC